MKSRQPADSPLVEVEDRRSDADVATSSSSVGSLARLGAALSGYARYASRERIALGSGGMTSAFASVKVAIEKLGPLTLARRRELIGAIQSGGPVVDGPGQEQRDEDSGLEATSAFESASIRLLKARQERLRVLHEQERVEVQEELDQLVVLPLGSDEERKEVAKRLSEVVRDLGYRLECSCCGSPASSLSFLTSRNLFRWNHRSAARRTPCEIPRREEDGAPILPPLKIAGTREL